VKTYPTLKQNAGPAAVDNPRVLRLGRKRFRR
jgi:hypothetical protein